MLARRAVELAPPGAVLSHTSAAVAHGLEFLDPWTPMLPTLTATCPRESRFGRNSRYRLYRADLPEAHTAAGDPPMTSAARTVVDLARNLPLDAAVVLADSALRKQLCTTDDLMAVYAACQTWPGALAAGKAVCFADPLCESPLESVVRVTLHEQQLPAPETQAEMRVGETTYRLDFFWKEQRTVGEADGLSKYTEPDVLRAEKLREDRLRDMGLEVVRITWDEIRGDPAAVADRVRAAFRRRQARD